VGYQDPTRRWKVMTTEIELRQFKDKLNEAKNSCSLVSQSDIESNVVQCLNNLVDAVELLADAVQYHYHPKPEEDRY
jgi:hypothetical protein